MSENSVKGNAFRRNIGQAAAPIVEPAAEPVVTPDTDAAKVLDRARGAFGRALARRRENTNPDDRVPQPEAVSPVPPPTSTFGRSKRQTQAPVSETVVEPVSDPAPERDSKPDVKAPTEDVSTAPSAEKAFQRDDRKDAPASPARSLLLQLRRQLGGIFAFAGLLTIFVNVAMLFVPLYSMIVFDRVMQSKSYDTLTMLSIVCVVGIILYGCLDFCRSMIFMVIADRLTRGLNISTLRASIARSLSGEPSAAAQSVRDLDSLRTFASSQSPIVSLDLIWTPVMLAVLYMLHPWYGHFALICAGVLFLLSIANDLTTRESLIEANNAAARSLSDLTAALRQRELIDGLGMLPEIARHWMSRQNKVLATAATISRRSTRYAVAAKTARLGMQGLGVAVGVILVIHHQASPGSLIGASILLSRMLLPFEQLITAWRQWIAAIAAWRRLADLLHTTPVRIGQARTDAVEGRVVIDQLGFAPSSASAPIIENITLTIEPGEVVAIVGPSGSGKSTLARLVMGVLTPTSGQVTFDGIPTSEWERTELARHVGYLAQSVGLLDGTILDNIARMDVADSAAAIDAANRAGVHDLVDRLRDGYGTQVGDSGNALSGGTRQRIALARALYGNPKLIVLDEPNANLDHDGEQALVRVIQQLRDAGTAVLLITHRPSILAAVDRIVGVEKGRITRIERASAQPQLANSGRAMAQAAG